MNIVSTGLSLFSLLSLPLVFTQGELVLGSVIIARYCSIVERLIEIQL